MTEAAIVRNEGGNTRRIGRKGLALLEEMAAKGMSQTSMAKALRIGRNTLTEIKKRQPEVEEAIERGYSQMEDVLVDRLYATAMGESKAAVTAAIFLLKTRRGYEGTKVPTHITINQDNRTQTIALPSAQDMDTYMRRIADGSPVAVPS
jgi:transcriptional regulator with XRE-family HTH domain